MFTPRGRGLIVGGVLLISCGLAFAGVGTLTTMVPFLFGSNDSSVLSQIGQQNNATQAATNTTDPVYLVLQLFNIPNSIVQYSMFLGTIMLLASIIGLPLFRIRSDTSAIRITRKLDREKAFAGEFIYVTIKVTNEGKAIDFIEIYDAIHETFELSMGENFIITSLGSNSSKIFSYLIRVTKRGVFRIGPSKVIIHSRTGFFFEEDIREFYTEILIYPSYQDIRRLEALSRKRQLGKMFGSHKTKEKGSGDDFHSLRKYVPGDEFKKLDWKAFSKTGELMVREFESEKNIRIVVFLDHSESMAGGVPDNTKLDFAIRSTMMIMHLAEDNRDIAGLITYSSQPTSYLAPNAKKGNFFQMLETLALVEPKGPSNPLAAVDFLMARLPRTSFYVFLTDLESANVDDFVEAAKRAISAKNRITIISPLGPLFESIMDLSPIEKAISEAIMEEFIQHRKMVEEALRGLDIEIINVGPDDMLAEVIASYHKAKASGKGVI